MNAAAGLVLAASLLAAISDIRVRRIPNALVLALFISGLAVNAMAGWQHALLDLGVVAAVLVAGTFLFSFRLIGGGDVKLLAAAAGTLGFPAAVPFILYTLLCGGVLAIIYSAMRGRLRATLTNVQSIALPIFAGAAPARIQSGTAMPYAVAIFAGACVSILASGPASYLRLLW